MAQAQLSLPDALNYALACHRAGDLGEAERLYRAILAVKPDYGDVFHLLGLVAHHGGHSETALGLVDRAIACGAESANVLSNRGIILQALHRPEEALASFARAASLQPNAAEHHINCGNMLQLLQRFEAALACYERALALRPDHAEALGNRGLALHHLQRFEAALESYDQALALRPDFADALSNRGNAFHALRRFEEALASYDAVLALRPNQAEMHYNRATALNELRRFDEALASYTQALALRPDYAEALSNRGVVLHALKRFDEALASYAQALALRPDYAEALSNRGAVLHAMARFDEALASYAQALAFRPDDAKTLTDRGAVLQETGRFDAALASYARAEAIDPDLAEAHWNEGLCRLLLGDFARGWPKCEWRWKMNDSASARGNFSASLWLGEEDLAGKTILLHAEQGLGDTIQFCRYVPLVAARANVVLEVQGPLVGLLKTLPGEKRIIAQGEALPAFDLHCPLLSLPLAFQTSLATIPGAVPYLAAAPDQIASWRSRLEMFPGIRVGLVWSGDPHVLQPQANAVDRRRSIPLERFAALAGIPGVTFVSLQKGEAAAQLRRSAFAPIMLDWMEEMKDFADTAALVEALDLVISVDTSMVHLVGALGKPVWLLNRFDTCWRWLLDRDDCPWYPTLRQFRQPAPGDWDTVIARVATELSRFAVMPRDEKAGATVWRKHN